MEPSNLHVLVRIFSERFQGFTFHKGKKTWVLETEYGVLLLVSLQESRMGPLFYLNFGAYFKGLSGPAEKCPKLTDWHLTARYEMFNPTPVSEYNRLFSLSENDAVSLEERCNKISSYIGTNILPRLLILGDFKLLREPIERLGASALEPYWAQNIKKSDVVSHVISYRPQ